MTEPTPRWLVATILIFLIGGVWWYVERRTAPPNPPQPVVLPYAK